MFKNISIVLLLFFILGTSMIRITSMSKYFDDGRGKAISLASLGHPLGEAFLPLLVLGVIAIFGWRGSLWFSAAAVLLLVPAFVYGLIKEKHLVVKESRPLSQTARESEANISQWQILKSKSFWTLAPNVFVLSFTVTGLFFYQFAIADFKGWSLEWMAMGLTAYAIAGSVAILFAGPLIDKYTAKVFFPFYLIPFLLGVFSIWFLDFRFAVFVYMTLLGLSAGFGGALKSALQVEFFGTRSIGSVRSIFTSLMVMSTAIGPFAFGAIVDFGFGLDTVFMFASVLLTIVIVLSFRALPSYTYKRMKYRLVK
ncbi:MFS transporter [Litoribacter populi]|uniref:MFS transporter n=1 Tax=Litoribacter populi TaxID=2598460 RepID=UPI00117F2FBB|nr:MFS transporter [Litoribacter populi]